MPNFATSKAGTRIMYEWEKYVIKYRNIINNSMSYIYIINIYSVFIYIYVAASYK